MGDGLQKAGHFFDSIAEFISPALEDEELIADQLKEYWLYANSLQAVYRQYELSQHRLETSQQMLADKKYEKLKLEQGGQTNFLLKIFGSVDSEDIREIKLQTIESRLSALTVDTEEAGAKVTEFVSRCEQENKRFEVTKEEDLRASLRNYVGLQIRMNRKCLSTWTNIKACIESIP
ncbi:sorting nexin-4-like [Diaphorina citri]|uniref:Sorting nexin-4-like n=1 Tax=Diaphorina citri TaxID=121845 RepID=A0A1S3CV81_DIACI|nr:sorting nexin-4-like [Diaphorina citri]